MGWIQMMGKRKPELALLLLLLLLLAAPSLWAYSTCVG